MADVTLPSRLEKRPRRSGRRHAGLAQQRRSRFPGSGLLFLTLPIAVFFFLVSCDALAPGRSPGEKLYRNHCANCHGVKGDGQTVRYMGNTWANLTDNYWKHGGDRSSLEHTLRTEVVFKHPSFDLSTQEIRQVVNHVVQLRSKKR